jgi:hypothetical protein
MFIVSPWLFPGADCQLSTLLEMNAMQKRRRFKQQLTLQERLTAWSKQVLDQAAKLPPGPERDALIKKARQADVACHLDEWAHSPELQPPV